MSPPRLPGNFSRAFFLQLLTEAGIGDLLKAIPKAAGGEPYKKKNSTTCSAAPSRTKEQVVKSLGFESTQAKRFEVLADNRDIVEQVKAEARENDDLPTRTTSRQLPLAPAMSREIIQVVRLGDRFRLMERGRGLGIRL